MRILVVDDNKVQTTALSMKLKAQGCWILFSHPTLRMEVASRGMDFS